MPKSKSRESQRKIRYGNTTYTTDCQDGKVTVRFQRTARGQTLIAGIYNITEKTWCSEERNGPLPSSVKDTIAKLFK
ncbi:hypothetical protein IJJ05_00290 [Candidatus Saccharibacteria bacterium]|nr:hypothetical protein [Candidatus Saccharibacteria bacterium]